MTRPSGSGRTWPVEEGRAGGASLRPSVPGPRPAGPGDDTRAPGRHADPTTRWSPTSALGRAILIVGLLLLIGVFIDRVDLVVLAAPFALSAALGLWRRPRKLPVVRLSVDTDFLTEGQPLSARLSVANADDVGYDLVVVRMAMSPWLRVPHSDRPYVTTTPPGTVTDVDLAGWVLRWGRPAIGPAVAHAFAADGLLISDAAVCRSLRVKAYPTTEAFTADDAMPRAAGLVGAHRSRRPGEGGELAGVRRFTPGDRLRRIDWRVSLRARELYVAATLSDRDAEVHLLLDVMHEAGRSGGVRGARSVMDTTVRAAAGIAEHYLHRGDRVSLTEFGSGGRRLRAASGRRQYLTILEWLLDVEIPVSGMDPRQSMYWTHGISDNALLVVLTPLLDNRAAEMLARFARAGRFVVAVDTLPPDVQPPIRGDWSLLAYRLWRMERDNTIGLLREHGVPLVAWAGAGSLDEVLRQVARRASGPRAVMR